MAVRTLVAGRSYFGLDALLLQRGAEQTLARVTNASEPVAITTETLEQDFQLDAKAAAALLAWFEKAGLLEPIASSGGYRLNDRLREYAGARVVPALRREQAQELLDKVIELAMEVNAKWKRNPLAIAGIAVSGSYMTRSTKVPQLDLWVVVRPRRSDRQAIWGHRLSKAEGAHEIRRALRGFGAFVSVRLAIDTNALPRPFTMVFDAEAIQRRADAEELLRS
jgi:hypothetical protein